MIVEHWIAPGLYAGAEQMVVGGVAALRDAGIDAQIVGIRELRRPELATAFDRRAQARALPTHWLDAAGRADGALLRAMQRRLRGPVSVVHTHGAKATIMAGVALGLRRLGAAGRRPSWVATHHGATSTDKRMRGYEQLLLHAYRYADAVCAVSAVTGELLLRRGVPSASLRVVENLLPRAGLTAVARTMRTPIALLFIGRLSPEKGLSLLLDALVDATPRVPIHLTIVGDGPERAALEAQCQRLRLQRSVTWAGYVDDVIPRLHAADALVLPSDREGLPLTLVEALVSGLPVLASAVGGIPEVVPHGAGMLLPAGHRRAWTHALSALPDRLSAMQAAAMASSGAMRERFAPSRWANETRALYRDLASEAR